LAKTGKQDAAARCFWESVKLLPISQRASYRLARQLVAINRSNEAKQLFEWSDQLDKIRQLLDLIYGNRDLKQPDEKMMQLLVRAAELTESMGRRREAWAWYRFASSFAPDNLEIRKQVMRLNKERAQQAPMVLAESLPTRNVDLSSLPLPDWSDLTKTQTASSADEFILPKFTDMAAAARIDFIYHNAEKLDVDGMMIYQQNGGAVVAFDYDVDGWPDLYLSQGCAWPPQENDTKYRDRLFRNLGNGQFMDVTEQARLGDQRFSQGATAGDFDNDGYPDLYLCNIGGNRFYRNQGDGTFAEISESAEVVGNDWSTSCLIADLNGDGLPDMYVVNYLEGREPLETVCVDEGHTRACSPLNFPGGQDRFYLNLGDGRFEDATSRAGFEIPDGKGLGLVAADLHGTGRKSIYVSNDATANFLFVRDQDEPVHFEERALLSGVAYDGDGQAQGSMGIAIGDLNGDLLFDIFVTHFYDESNTIYRQVADGFFADASREYGMQSQSMEKLAFGTEVLDYDLDSYPDLVVVNGHVDDFRYKDEPFWMQPQIFRNARRRGFEEVDGQLIGEYFQGKYLGRALATLDWNRDGKLDFAVMHLQRPVALLTNETQTTHNSITLHLRGVQSERMAFGATVTVTHDGHTTIHQLVAGGGYQCCNQTMLQFGLAAAEQAEQVVVRWPSGLEQVFDNVPAKREYLLVEGAAELAELPRHEDDGVTR
jgi:hypothetical protein